VTGGVDVWLAPHVASVALISARLLPMVFLCPLLGGEALPSFVKVALALCLACGFHSGGVHAPEAFAASEWRLGAAAVRECLVGVAIGLVAGLPFDAARMGGRFIDLFRGASAEAALPQTGSRESATGDVLYQLVLAWAAQGPLFGVVTSALWHSFVVLPLGGTALTGGAFEVITLAGTALATGLGVGAPIAGLALLVDFTLGLWGKVAPGLSPHELRAPLKLLGGGAVLWLVVGLVAERLLALVARTPSVLAHLLGST
jgi:flagellar biosynthetic protein FliR/type III secretion protein T